MKYSFALLVFIGLIACTGNKGSNLAEDNRITEKEVHNAIYEWAQAILNNRLEPQQKILDDTWIYSGSDDGRTTTKKKALAGFQEGETSLKNIVLQDTLIRLYGNVAIVTGREQLTFVEEKDTSKVSLRFTDVFIKRAGVVKVIGTHSSPIN